MVFSSGLNAGWGKPREIWAFWLVAFCFLLSLPGTLAAAVIDQTVASTGAGSAWNGGIWGTPAAIPNTNNTYRITPGLTNSAATGLLNGQKMSGRVYAFSATNTFKGASLEVPVDTGLIFKDNLPATFTANLVLNGGIIRSAPNTNGIATLAGTLAVVADSVMGVVHANPGSLIINSTITGSAALRLAGGGRGNHTVALGGDLSAFTGQIQVGGGVSPIIAKFNQNYNLPAVELNMVSGSLSDRLNLDRALTFKSFSYNGNLLAPGTYTAAALNGTQFGLNDTYIDNGGTLTVSTGDPFGIPKPFPWVKVFIIGDSTVASYNPAEPGDHIG